MDGHFSPSLTTTVLAVLCLVWLTYLVPGMVYVGRLCRLRKLQTGAYNVCNGDPPLRLEYLSRFRETQAVLDTHQGTTERLLQLDRGVRTESKFYIPILQPLGALVVRFDEHRRWHCCYIYTKYNAGVAQPNGTATKINRSFILLLFLRSIL